MYEFKLTAHCNVYFTFSLFFVLQPYVPGAVKAREDAVSSGSESSAPPLQILTKPLPSGRFYHEKEPSDISSDKAPPVQFVGPVQDHQTGKAMSSSSSRWDVSSITSRLSQVDTSSSDISLEVTFNQQELMYQVHTLFANLYSCRTSFLSFT